MTQHRPTNTKHTLPEQSKHKPSPLLSGIAALFGIQSKRNQIQDFQQGNPKDFIIAGIFIVLSLVMGMILLVKYLISIHGAV